MPRKKKEVFETCKRIEYQFPTHVLQVKAAVNRLKKEELTGKATVSFYATKLRECRERVGLTETAVGNLIGLSHVSIVGYENALRPRANIDRAYLEMFALIYDVSPLYLIGKTDNPMDYVGDMPLEKLLSREVNAIEFVFNNSDSTTIQPSVAYAHGILKTLYQEGCLASAEDRTLMQIFLRICDAKDKRREEIKTALFGIPTLQKLLSKISKEDFINRPIAKTSAFCRLEKGNEDHLLETMISLHRLGEKDIELLQCLLAIARGTDEEKSFVILFLKTGGFIDDSSSFVQNTRSTKLQ